MASTCCGHTGLCDTVLFIFLCILNISSDFKMPVFSFLETYILGGNPRWLSGKESTCQYRRCRRRGFDLWVRKIRWRRKWQPTPVFLPGKFPWTEEPGGLQSIGFQWVGHDCMTKQHISTFTWYISPKTSMCFLLWVFAGQIPGMDLSMCVSLSVDYMQAIWLSSSSFWFQFSRSVVSDSLRAHELQHARPSCPSPTPRVHPNSCPSSRWCHPSHLILCRPLLLLPPIPPSIWVFSNESTLCMRLPKYWSFSFSINPSNEHPGLISFRMD